MIHPPSSPSPTCLRESSTSGRHHRLPLERGLPTDLGIESNDQRLNVLGADAAVLEKAVGAVERAKR